MAHPLIFDDISNFSPEISNFFYIKKCKDRLYFNIYFLILLTFFESLKVFLINMIAILMMSAELAIPGFFEIKYFEIKIMMS